MNKKFSLNKLDRRKRKTFKSFYYFYKKIFDAAKTAY